MAEKKWESVQKCFCDHVEMDVSLDVEVIYPADYLDDQSLRVAGHRCSNGEMCNQFNQGACIWAGTNPMVDPFKDE